MAYSEIFSFGHFVALLATSDEGECSLLISLRIGGKVAIKIIFSKENLQNLITEIDNILQLSKKEKDYFDLYIDTDESSTRLFFTDKDEMTKFESGLVKALNAIHDSDDE